MHEIMLIDGNKNCRVGEKNRAGRVCENTAICYALHEYKHTIKVIVY